MEAENKEERAIRQFEILKPQILKLFLDAPKFGVTSLAVHFMDGAVKRITHYREESVIPEQNEDSICVKRD